MKQIIAYIVVLITLATLPGCKGENDQQPALMYTCPMPEDSVFSDKPGKCPKCGMELVEVQTQESHDHGRHAVYTCSMHPEIEQETPGQCPICGMDLVKKASTVDHSEAALHTLIRNPDMSVASGLPVTQLKQYSGTFSILVYGQVGYDPRQVGSLSSYVSGRIVKLYISHPYEQVRSGQRIMDIYSPEIQTAQQELLYLLAADASNAGLIQAASSKLRLLGMSLQQVNSVVRNRKALPVVSVYSTLNGHIHDAVSGDMAGKVGMEETSVSTAPLSIREGMYVEKGKPVFTVYDHRTVWAVFQLPAEQSASIRTGDQINIQAERDGNHQLHSTITFIEPFARAGSTQVLLRADLKDHQHLAPGTPLQGEIMKPVSNADVLPASAVTSLGIRKVVYTREKGMLMAKEVKLGRRIGDDVEVLSGVSPTDSVVVNGRFLADNESIIRVKK